MKVTAIITAMTEGERPYVDACLQSVLENSVDEVIVCVHEGSKWDNLWTQNSRVTLLPLPMMPVGWVRNRAIERAKGDYVAFCDGDDWWRGTGKIKAQLALGAPISGTSHVMVDESGTVRALGFAKRLPMLSSWLVHRDILREHPFNETMRTASDVEWWRRVPAVKARYPWPTLAYRVRNGSLSSGGPKKERKARFVALGSVPVLGKLVLIATFVRWAMLVRHRAY